MIIQFTVIEIRGDSSNDLASLKKQLLNMDINFYSYRYNKFI